MAPDLDTVNFVVIQTQVHKEISQCTWKADAWFECSNLAKVESFGCLARCPSRYFLNLVAREV